jgi:hypothetical protein
MHAELVEEGTGIVRHPAVAQQRTAVGDGKQSAATDGNSAATRQQCSQLDGTTGAVNGTVVSEAADTNS